MTKKLLILSIGIFVGLLLVLQWRSQTTLSSLTSARTSRTDPLQEIMILLSTNQALREEIADLTAKKQQYASSVSARAEVEKDLASLELLAGDVPVQGNGITIKFSVAPTLAQLTDLQNELCQLGSAALSFNDFRLTNTQAGLSSLGGQLVFDGHLLTTPIFVRAVGDATLLTEALSRSDSTLALISAAAPDALPVLTSEVVVLPAQL